MQTVDNKVTINHIDIGKIATSVGSLLQVYSFKLYKQEWKAESVRVPNGSRKDKNYLRYAARQNHE